MVDFSPLEEAHDLEENPERKAVLKLALDLLGCGYTSHFMNMYTKGRHHNFMSPQGVAAFEKVMKEFEANKEEEKNNGKKTIEKRKGKGKVPHKKGKGKVIDTPLPRSSARFYELRRMRGVGVKIGDPKEEEKDEKMEEVFQKGERDENKEKAVDEVQKDEIKEEVFQISAEEELLEDDEVEEINEVLFNYYLQLPPAERERYGL